MKNKLQIPIKGVIIILVFNQSAGKIKEDNIC
jgi:hypothetical protein